MFQQTLAIVRNSFFESVRQPIMLVVLLAATIALIFCNPLSAFTMENDQRMLIDIGLATVFLCGALLAAFIATNVLGREIENRTVLTVVSKPVARPVFVIGKFLGVACAMLLGTLYMGFMFLQVEQHAVLQTVRDPMHAPVWVFTTLAFLAGLGVALWCNYFYGKVFASTFLCATTPLLGLAYLFSMMFDPGFNAQPISLGFKPQLWLALGGLTIAILMLTAIALAASTRLGQVMTLLVTVGLFVLGMLSDWIFVSQGMNALENRWLARAREEGVTVKVQREQVAEILTKIGVEPHPISSEVELSKVPLTEFATGWELTSYGICRVGYAIVPNFQVMLLSDAVTQQHRIPGRYLGATTLYGTSYILATLGLATVLFQRREVG